jgi:microcystin-dependent protein
MPSTYTASGIELIADGEQSGTWGQTTNDNLQIIDRMTSQAGTITLSGTTHTLTISDGTLSDGQYGVLVFAGSPSGTNTVTISPNDAKRVFIVRNTTAQSVVMTQGSGGNVTILSGDSAVVYCTGAGAGAAVVDVSSTFITSNNLVAANNLSDLTNTSTARTNLGVAIGTNVQAWDANLDQIAALAVTDGNIIVGNGSAWVAESGATARTSLGVAIGTNVQAWDANLDQIAALAVTDGNFIVGNGSAWVAESGATVRTSLGLGTAATLNVGTSANNIVQLDGSAKLPAVDGSQLTGIAGIPSGVITLWSGSTASIPSGWVICDGTNSTPDLRNFFVVGAGDTYAVGATGGSNTVTLAETNLPGHTHSVSGTTASDGAHTHNVSGNTSNTGAHTHNVSGNTSNTGAHTHSGSTSNTGAHTHPSNIYNSGGPEQNNQLQFGPVTDRWTSINNSRYNSAGAHSHNFTTNSDGAHSHTLSGTADSAGAHSHTLSGTADSAGAHTHTFSATTGSTGSGTAHENRPPYYALAYIMKT